MVEDNKVSQAEAKSLVQRSNLKFSWETACPGHKLIEPEPLAICSEGGSIVATWELGNSSGRK